MRIAYFTKYTRKGASSRLRSFQFIPYLERSGCDVSVYPLFSDTYLEKLYSKQNIGKWLVAKAYLNRFIQLGSARRFDVIIIEKELFPYLPAWAEMLMGKIGIKYIADYDDAIFHNYDLHEKNVVRFMLRNKIPMVMKYARAVTVGNKYLYAKALQSKARDIYRLPTVVDVDRYSKKDFFTPTTVTLGWIGSPSTLKYLKDILPVIGRLAKKYDIRLNVIGGNENLKADFLINTIPWSEETEADEILKFDIGIMPLEDSLWDKGKCAYKIIQYMACAIPAVASPVGMNNEVIQHGVNGYLAPGYKEWYSHLESLIVDAHLRKAFGAHGRVLVEEKYSLDKRYQELYHILMTSK